MNPRIALIGLGLVVLVSACGGGSSGGTSDAADAGGVGVSPSPTHHHHHHPPTPTPTPTVTVTETASAPTTPTTAGCRSASLSLMLGQSDGTAGTIYQPIVFVNNGSHACSLYGYPGVSFVTAGGKLIGLPASQDPGKKSVILLASGGEANVLLRMPDPGNFAPSSCAVKTADRLRVYPPGETVPLYVHDSAQVCSTSAARTGVTPVRSGNGAS